MEGYRIRRRGTERAVGDTAALVALARAGQLAPNDEVLTPNGWVAARDLPDVRPHLRAPGADPWAAWSDVDSVDAASLYKKMVEGEPEELPVEALAPVEEGAPPRRSVMVIDRGGRPPAAPPAAPPAPSVSSPAPASPPPVVAPPELPGGEVIDFPHRRPPPPPVDLPRPRRPRPAPPPPAVRGSRVLVMVLVGALALGIGYWWIRVGAWSKAGLSPVLPERPAAAEPAPASPLIALDAELRQGLSATPKVIAKPGDLSDALLLELTQQRLDVLLADGTVTKWIGRHGDEPKIAEVRIQYRSSGELSRELGAIALVVGRYKRLYRLDMPVFEVVELGTHGLTRIDPDKAEAYYQARISLEDLLHSIAGHPGG